MAFSIVEIECTDFLPALLGLGKDAWLFYGGSGMARNQLTMIQSGIAGLEFEIEPFRLDCRCCPNKECEGGDEELHARRLHVSNVCSKMALCCSGR
jgi:hypothetical protein